MTTITDEYMRERLGASKTYTLVILKTGPNRNQPGADKIVWEHARKNFALLAKGILSIVGPVLDESEVSGIYIFDGTADQVKEIMDGDPGVKAGVFAYEIHPFRGFPGSSLT